MSILNTFNNKVKFTGNYNSTRTYFLNDVTVGSDKIVYKALSTIIGQDPVLTTGYWEILIPTAPLVSFTTSAVTKVSSSTFGINAGSTFTWAAAEWNLELSGTSIILNRIKSNCNCNCNCNCSTINCNCASNCNCFSNCNCASNCNCFSNCDCSTFCVNCYCTSYCSWMVGQCVCDCLYDCTTLCYCASNCNCYSDCNCASNCNCFSNCDCASNCNCNCSAI